MRIFHIFLMLTSIAGGSETDLKTKDIVRIYPPVPEVILEKMITKMNSVGAREKEKVCINFNSKIFWKSEKKSPAEMNKRATENCVKWVKNHLRVKKKMDAVFAEVVKRNTATANVTTELEALWWRLYNQKDGDYSATWERFLLEFDYAVTTDYLYKEDVRRVMQKERFKEMKRDIIIPWWALGKF